MKKLLSIIEIIAIVCVMCLGVVSTSMVANAEGEKGLSFVKDAKYTMNEVLEAAPITIEAEIKLESGKGGAILSNYFGYYPSMRLEVVSGKLRFVTYDAYDSKGNTVSYTFETRVDTGEWLKLAVVRNFAAKEMYLYIDGVLKETLEINEDKGFVGEKALVIGDEPYYWNNVTNRFQGVIKGIKLYSDMRTAEEVNADLEALDKSSLLAAYDMSEINLGEQPNLLPDLSENENDAETVKKIAPAEGLSFNDEAKYILESPLGAAPITVEATIWLGSDQTEAAGSIFSNYNSYNPCFKLEVVKGGLLRYYSYDSTTYTGNNFNYYCTTPINLSRWVNIAFVRDFSAKQVYFYIDGELVQTLPLAETVALSSGSNMVIGNEHYHYQGINPYFMGKIKDLKVYSDVRTAAEVKADMTSLDKSNLLAGFDMSSIRDGDVVNYLPDLSANSNDAVSTNQQLPSQGMKFGGDIKYELESKLPKEAVTYEATVWVPKNYQGEPGAIISNYSKADASSNAIYVYSNGRVGYYSYDKPTNTIIRYISNTNIATGEWINIAVVRDYQKKQIRFYFDGVLKETQTLNETVGMIGDYKFYIGDERSYYADVPVNFIGKIKDIKLYSDMRTDAEIKADVNSHDTSDMLLGLDMSAYNSYTELAKIPDMSAYSNDAFNLQKPIPIEGLEFNTATQYKLEKILPKVPNTFEFEVLIPEGKTGNLGSIISNYNGYNPSMKFEVIDGVIRYYSYDAVGSGGNDVSYFFNTKLNTGKWYKVAVTRDYQNRELKLYVDGELQESRALKDNDLEGVLGTSPLMIGSAYQTWSTNPINFLGKLKSVKLYSDVRTAAEVKNDFGTLDTSDLLVAYDMTNVSRYNTPTYLDDLSPNKINANDLSKGKPKYGLAGNWNRYYDTTKLLSALPKTFEFTVCIPKGDTGYRVLMSNFTGYMPAFTISVTAGKVRYFHDDAYELTGTQVDYTFSQNIATGEYVHIAITRDIEGGKMHLYVNGVFSETITLNSADSAITGVYPVRIGDERSGENAWLEGKLKDVRVYSVQRSYDDIKKDAVATADKFDKNNLLLGLDFSGVIGEESPERFEDLSDCDNDAYIQHDFLDEADVPEVGEYDYSFAIVGDTQYLAWHYPDRIHYIYDWLLNNKTEQKIELVMHMGDLTEWDDEAQWNAIMPQIKRLDGIIPYSLVRGNHDTSAAFNKYCSYDSYMNTLGGYIEGDIANTWKEIIIGDMKYLVVTIDYNATYEECVWASDVIAAHPEHNAILTTHGYLSSFNQVIFTGYWDWIVKNNPNVSMVFCGHEYMIPIVYRTDNNSFGNPVLQMMVDPQVMDKWEQPSYGLIAMMYFSDGGKKAQVRYYSTVYDKWFTELSQFEVFLHTIHPKGDINTDGRVNSGDALTLKKAVIGKDFADKYSVASCDMNGDGVRDVRDLIRFKRFLAGLKSLA